MAVVGTGLLSFYNTMIRVDTPVRRTIDGQSILTPDVQILDQTAPLPVYSRKIAMSFGGMGPATTACFYGFPDIFGGGSGRHCSDDAGLWRPAVLPTGGNFFARVGAIEGEPGPYNPLQYMRMMVDTGSQSSIITPAMAANLNLDPASPDFTVDICGIGGLTQGVPGFYVDYIKINASGGAMEFSQVPFVVVDVPSPDGGEFDGMLGMNFFWNRNVIFEPSLSLAASCMCPIPCRLPTATSTATSMSIRPTWPSSVPAAAVPDKRCGLTAPWPTPTATAMSIRPTSAFSSDALAARTSRPIRTVGVNEMIRTTLAMIWLLSVGVVFGQESEPVGVHQQEYEAHRNDAVRLGQKSIGDFDVSVSPLKILAGPTDTARPTSVIFGYLPYWERDRRPPI